MCKTMIVEWSLVMLNAFKHREIKYQIIMLISLMLMAVVVAIIFIFVKMNDQLQEQNKANILENIKVIENRLENTLTELDYVSNSLSLNDGIAEIAYLPGGKTNIELYTDVYNDMIDLVTTTEVINNIGFVGNDGTFYNLGFDQNKNEQISIALEDVGKGTKMVYLGLIESTSDQTREFLFAANIYDTELTIDTIGYVVLLVDDGFFREAFKSDSGEYYLVDQNQNIILADGDLEGLPLAVDGNYIFGKSEWIVSWPMTVVARNTSVQLNSSIIETSIVYLVLIGLMLIMLIVTYIFLDRRVTKPMGEISSFIQDISGGEIGALEKRLKISGSREVEEISEELNEMLDEISRLTDDLVDASSQLYISEIEKREAELNSLKSQINPHFLYNTLGVIRGIAIMRDDEETKTITSALVQIYRYSIKGQDVVEFNQELDICKAYLEVQRIRFKNRFDVDYRFHVDMSNVLMLKMVLQPLVENAIVHSVELRSERSKIIIGSQAIEEGIEVYISDDGVGIDEDKLKFLKDQLENQDSSAWHKEHVGLMNVHTRLKHMWGTGLNIESQVNQGTTISFIIKNKS